MRMLQTRGRSDLSQESFAAERRAEIRMQNLYGDVAIVFEIVCQIHRRHAAGADLAIDAITISHRSGESLYWGFDVRVRHLGSVVCVDTITMVRPEGEEV